MLEHPFEYAVRSAGHDAVASALGTKLVGRTTTMLHNGSARTVLRTAVELLR